MFESRSRSQMVSTMVVYSKPRLGTDQVRIAAVVSIRVQFDLRLGIATGSTSTSNGGKTVKGRSARHAGQTSPVQLGLVMIGGAATKTGQL